jgi:hypothetical protein
VSNLPILLPEMIVSNDPKRYLLFYDELGRITDITIEEMEYVKAVKRKDERRMTIKIKVYSDFV